MEAHLYLKAETGMIGSTTDFTYKWCVNMGLTTEESSRMTLAVDEILTDIILHGYGSQPGYVEIWYQYSLSKIEITIQETGEPFDPERHTYSPERAVRDLYFEGAGLEIVKKMTDHFIFLNRGKEGKEFRLIKNFAGSHIRDFINEEEVAEDNQTVDNNYLLTPVTSEDAEDIAKLIYKSYDYTYSKEELYFPRRIELAIRHKYKFGTIVRTSLGGPAGYFAVIRNTNSRVGEVGEVVVSPQHRKKGLMKRMLHELIEMSRVRGLLGLYGMALTVHTISQKVNENFGFKSTALMLAKSPSAVYKGIREDYPQPISTVVDFLPLTTNWRTSVFLPRRYASLLMKIYEQFNYYPEIMELPDRIPKENSKTELNLILYYESNSALVFAHNLGNNFANSCRSMIRSLEELELTSVYIDIPLHQMQSDSVVEWLHENGFILSGLMPFFHQERDYLRMQKINIPLDFDLIEIHSRSAGLLKNRIEQELREVQKEKQ